jgi:hypothetical protein
MRSKAAGVFLVFALGVCALVALGWLFRSELGVPTAREDAAVILTPPAGYRILAAEAHDRAAAAADLLALIESHPQERRFGVRFAEAGGRTLLLADTAADTLEAREAGASGTRLRTVWRGSVASRLSWCQMHGGFDAPWLPPPEQKNLYH